MKGSSARARESTGDTRVVLAVDAGGTTTRAGCFAASGECLGAGVAGAANPVAHGPLEARAQVLAAAVGALGEIPGEAVEKVVIGLAGGAQRPELEDLLARAFAELGVVVHPDILSDGQAAFSSGTLSESGYVLVAGTGAVALRILEGEVTRAVDGMGWLLGDSGSGFWIGREVVRAVLAHLDGRAPATSLTPLVLDRLGIDPSLAATRREGRSAAVGAIEAIVYAAPPLRVALLASLVFEAADDDVARGILESAASALTTTLATAWDPVEPGPVVVAGGLLASFAELRERLSAGLVARGGSGELLVARDGVVGLAVIALRSLRIRVGEELFASLVGGWESARMSDAASGQRRTDRVGYSK